MADPSRERVRSYVEKGVTFAGEENGKIVAAAVVERSGAHFELKNIAVSESHQGTGLGRQLLRHVLRYAANEGARSVVVGTGNSSLRPLAFYQRNGFRITDVVAGFFEDYQPSIVENGIPCRDRIRLTFEIMP